MCSLQNYFMICTSPTLDHEYPESYSQKVKAYLFDENAPR